MLKTFLCFVCLIIFSLSVYSQRSGVWRLIPYPETQSINMGHIVISAANSTDIATITDATDSGFEHEVRVSHDSGSTWKTLLTENVGTSRWWGIHHPLPSTYLVTGDSTEYLGKVDHNSVYKYYGLFYFSNDSGQTWKKTIIGDNSIVFAGYMQNELEGALIVGYVGNVDDTAANQPQDSLLVTTDGWKTWTARGLPAGGKGCWGLVGLEKGSYITYSFYPQNFYVTTDDGVHWDVYPGVVDYGIHSIAAITPQHLFAVGATYRGIPTYTLMYESFDRGKTWTKRLDSALGTTDGFKSISFSEDKMHGVAVGSSIMRTEDGGVTWKFDDVPYEVGLWPYAARGVYCASRDLAVAVMGEDQLMLFKGKTTLKAPLIHDHEIGPLPLGHTEIAWAPIEGATAYRLQVSGKLLSQNTYDTAVYHTPLLDTLMSDTTVLFNAQIASFGYYVRVQAVNDEERSVWNEKASLFYTVSERGKMLPPKIESPANGAHLTPPVLLAWTPVEGATSYQVVVAKSSFIPVEDFVTTSTFATITNLKEPRHYSVSIRAFGEDDSSDWSNGNFVFYIDDAGVVEDHEAELILFPNPTRGELHVSSTILEANPKIYILDLMGNRLSVPRRHEAGEIVFDLRSIPAGSYFLVIDGNERVIRHISVIR